MLTQKILRNWKESFIGMTIMEAGILDSAVEEDLISNINVSIHSVTHQKIERRI